MMKFIALWLLSSTLIAVVVAASEVRVESFSPTIGLANGGETITIHGCGFREYAGALCQFGPFTSTHSIIVNDKEIHCQTPNFIEANYDGVYFSNLPAHVDLTVQYDGDATVLDTLSTQFHIGPLISSMTPTRGPTAGGGTITITGMGFSDLGSVLVKFDGVSAGSSTVVSSTQITATIPPGDFNAQRMVTLHFSSGGAWSTFYDLVSMVYTYGPYVSSPSCNSFIDGGNTITITGNYFGDFNPANIRVNFTRDFVMEAFEPITQIATFLSETQIQVVTPAISPSTGMEYGLPIGMVVWGAENDEIAYNEARGAGQNPSLLTFNQPAIDSVTPISPTRGWLGGNNSFTIHGCGFSEFNNTQLEVTFGGISVCTGATISSFSDTEIICKVPTSGHNCESNPIVNLDITSGGLTRTETVGNYAFGPIIDKSTITATRGKVTGGDTFTISGSFFDYRPEPLTDFSEYNCVFHTIGEPIVNATRDGDTLACTTPNEGFDVGGAGVTAEISFRFGTAADTNDETSCAIPTASVDRPTWLWYPVCDSIYPTYGALDAGTVVTVTGEGWNDYKWPAEDTPANVALAVIFTANYPGTIPATTWEQLGTDLSVISDTTFTVTTPVNRYTDRGGNRRFGSTGEMNVYLNSSDALNGANLTHVVACTSNTFRYGPIVTGITPQKGPIGPAGATSPNTAVTVSGLGFEEFNGKSSAVLFGSIEQGSSAFSGSSVDVQTRWADFYYSDERGVFKTDSNTIQDVSVYFDTCNKTMTDIEFHWGPSITGVSSRWGYHPNGGIILTINGVEFSEFMDVKVWVGDRECTSATVASNIAITCSTPPLEFGTNATVRVSFGTTCGIDTTNYDLSRTIQTESIYYMPRITQINPTFGKVSGGTLITCTGEGFENFMYTSQVYVGDHVASSTIGMGDEFQVVIPRFGSRLPQGRGVWDLDQPISVALDGIDSWRVWFENFHYGPVCSGIAVDGGTRTHGKIAGGETFTVDGQYFNDEQAFDYGNTVVSVGTPPVATVTNHTTANGIQFVTPPATCGTTQAVKVSFQGPGQPLMEMTCPGLYYGPVIPTQPLINEVCSGATGRGWHGDTFSISAGSLLNDGAYAGTLTTTVGGLYSNVSAVSDSGFTFEVPTVAWGQTHTVSVSWDGCPAMDIGTITTYPQINAISPTVGSVGGTAGVLILGSFFDCFGGNTGDPDDWAVQWGTGTPINATVGGGSFILPIANSPAGPLFTSDIITVWFNRTGTAVSRSVDDNGAQIDFWYGPYVTGMNPTSGKLRGSEPFTIIGLNLDDAFFNDTVGCSFSGERFDSFYPPSTTEITCFTPEFMGDCMTTPGKTIEAVWFEASGGAQRTSVQTLPTFELGPQIFSIDTQRSITFGGGSVVVTGVNFLDFLQDGLMLFARCIFGNVYSEPALIAGDASISCTIPRGAFGKSGMFGMIFDAQTDSMTNLNDAWHWHAYSDNSLSNTVIDYYGFETVHAEGGGFCGYDWATADVAGKTPLQSSVISNWQASFTTSPIGNSGVVTVSFCDNGGVDCSCEYLGSPDTLSFGSISLVNVPPPPPVTTTTITTSTPPTTTTITTSTPPPTTITTTGTTSTPTTTTVTTTGSTVSTTVSTTVSPTTSNGTTTNNGTTGSTTTGSSTTVSLTSTSTTTTNSTTTTLNTTATTDNANNLTVSFFTVVILVTITLIFSQ